MSDAFYYDNLERMGRDKRQTDTARELDESARLAQRVIDDNLTYGSSERKDRRDRHWRYSVPVGHLVNIVETAERLLDLQQQAESCRSPVEAPLKGEWDNAWFDLGAALAQAKEAA